MTNCWRYLNKLGIFYHCKSTIRYMTFLAHFYRSFTDLCNAAKVTTGMLPISVRYLCRNSKRRADLSRYFKWFIMESRFLPSSQISGRMYNTVVSINCMMWKVCRRPTLFRYLQTIIDFKWQKQDSLSSFRPLTGWGLHRFVWKFQREQLKGKHLEWYFSQPTSYLIGQYLWQGF